jgi:hypothetical protein
MLIGINQIFLLISAPIHDPSFGERREMEKWWKK